MLESISEKSEHISEKDLLLAFDGELPSDRNEAVRAHTRECRECEARWESLANLSQNVMTLCPNVTLQPQETAVATLMSRLDKAGAPKKTYWMSHSLAFANALVAVAVAITCIVVFPSLRVVSHTVSHTPVAYETDQSVPPGYVSLPFADPALPLDDAAVVPVQLSAEDLELMGFDAVDAANAAPQGGVQAEILIGMDGWPRAIRFVE
jgi:hypothetical protein